MRSVKAKITKECKAIGNDSSLSAADRDLLAADLRRLIGVKHQAINQITFLADGSVKVSMFNNAVDEEDVEKWIAELQSAATE